MILHPKLRYYATFKLKKIESLISKIIACLLKLPPPLDFRQSKNILCKYITHIFFNFERRFFGFFYMSFLAAPGSFDKEI